MGLELNLSTSIKWDCQAPWLITRKEISTCRANMMVTSGVKPIYDYELIFLNTNIEKEMLICRSQATVGPGVKPLRKHEVR
jgi:hypothetical protein